MDEIKKIAVVKEVNITRVDKHIKEAKDILTEEFEVKYLTYHLKKNDGNISKTAQSCGMDRRTIHRLIQKHNIIYKDNS